MKITPEVLKTIEATITTFADIIKELMETNQQEHSKQLSAIDNAIIPAIDILKDEIQGQRGEVTIMSNSVTNQEQAIQQILASLQRVEQSLQTIASGVDTLNADLDTQKNEILTIKADMSKLQTSKVKDLEDLPKDDIEKVEKPVNIEPSDSTSIKQGEKKE